MKSVTRMMRASILAAALASSGAAFAEEIPQASISAEGGDTELLSLEDMDALAGGTGVDVVTITEQTLTAVNGGNSVTGDTVGSGQVNIGADAFSGYSGLGNFVINTGHNNNLQASMSVSIVLTPPGPGS